MPDPLLRLGSADLPGAPLVSAWQTDLRRLGYPLGSDGDFGPVTRERTMSLQRDTGLWVDGVVGPLTSAAAQAQLSARPPLLDAVDVSGHQRRVDWVAVRASGVELSWHKATEGSTLADRTFADGVRAASGAGLRVGAYHFLTDSSPPERQAAAFLRALEPVAPLLAIPPFLDVERSDASGGTPGLAHVLPFLRELDAALPARLRAWVYAGPSYVLSRLQGAPELASRHLLLAQYAPRATVPAPWAAWSGWQWTGKGRVPGIGGDADRSVVRPEALPD